MANYALPDATIAWYVLVANYMNTPVLMSLNQHITWLGTKQHNI